MKKNFAILAMMMVIAVLFAGCGQTTNSTDSNREAVNNLTDFAATQQKLAETYDPNDPADAARMMENYAEFGAQMELREFERAEAVDAPSGFPSSLIYGKGKLTASSDDGDADYINQSITIKTTEDMKTVKEFYKNLFSQAPWRITSQSSESDSASYKAKDASNREASVDISADVYSKLVDIRIWYSGDIVQQ